jgi:cell division protein ZapD
VILYEYPFNERIRTYLRLEHLFQRLDTLANRSAALDHHYAIQTLFEITDVAARSDMKSDVLKDLDRQRQHLGGFRDNPAINARVLDAVLQRLNGCYDTLSHTAGKAGVELADDEALMAIRSRMGIPAGTCSFDLPSYHHWQHSSDTHRLDDITRWTAHISPLREAVTLLLSMLRDTGTPHKVTALNGQFQQNLPQGKTFQLLRLRIDPDLGLVPEISGNRLMVSVRLMQFAPGQVRTSLHQGESWFELTLCS